MGQPGVVPLPSKIANRGMYEWDKCLVLNLWSFSNIFCIFCNYVQTTFKWCILWCETSFLYQMIYKINQSLTLVLIKFDTDFKLLDSDTETVFQSIHPIEWHHLDAIEKPKYFLEFFVFVFILSAIYPCTTGLIALYGQSKCTTTVQLSNYWHFPNWKTEAEEWPFINVLEVL